MEDYLMAIGLFNESKSLNHRTDDWEQDITRLQRRAELYDRRQAIKAIFAQIVKFFSRPTMALRAARV